MLVAFSREQKHFSYISPMKFISPLFISIIFWNVGFSQQTKFIADKNLSLYFPSAPDSGNMKGMKIFYLNTENISYQALLAPNTALGIQNEKDFNEALKGIVVGMYETPQLRSFKKEDNDTVIGGVKGKFIHAYAIKKPSQFESMYTFATVQDDHAYMIQTLVLYKDDSTMEKIRSFYSDIEFCGIPYTPSLEGSAAYKIGRVVGKFLIYGLIAFGFVWLIIRLAK